MISTVESNSIAYYTLRYQETDRRHRAGERVATSADTFRIGQQEDCDARLDNPTDLADETFAVIARDGEGWVLIPMSDFVDTRVNGTKVELAQGLSNGDRISFSEGRQELVFNVHHDHRYDPSKGNVRIPASMSMRVIAALVLLPIILFGVLGWIFYRNSSADEERTRLLDEASKAVVQISVDSVYYCRIVGNDTTVLDAYSYIVSEKHAISGTAFLTTDSLLVTARHCVEPWLNTAEAVGGSVDSIESLPVIWAIQAETYNQTHECDTTYRVFALCELFRGEKGTEPWGPKIGSWQMCYDSSRDDIVDLGTFTEDRYWRSITRHNARTDMMLDDIACCRVGEAGTIALALPEELPRLLPIGAEIYFMGYPDYNITGFEIKEGRVRLPYNEGDVIAHDGGLYHGYSGGPTLVVDGDEVKAVGVISVTDNTGGNRMYSVPVSELPALKKGGEQ